MTKIIQLYFIMLLAFSHSLYAENYLDKKLKKTTWNGVEVNWIVEPALKTYDLIVKFEQGSISDRDGKKGATSMAFNQLFAGTNRYTRKEIADYLEFFGTTYGFSVTHEQVLMNLSGLAKDAGQTLRFMCHLMDDATFPTEELTNEINRQKSALKNLPSNQGALASRAHREISLAGSLYAYPSEGKLVDLERLKSQDLKERLQNFHKEVKKKIYVIGPKSLEELEKVIHHDCGWSKENTLVNHGAVVKNGLLAQSDNLIHFVELPGSNQAQIRLGRLLTQDEAQKDLELTTFASKVLGGGFTSLLVTELRVKRGLTYSASSMAGPQKNYGRAVISTFTRNEEVANLLMILKNEMLVSNMTIDADNFLRMKRFAKGSYLFGLETNSSMMGQLITFDHIGKKFKDIYLYPQIVDSLKKEDVEKKIYDIFGWSKQIVLVAGDPSLIKTLRQKGFEVKSYKAEQFL
jgi:zinc protease